MQLVDAQVVAALVAAAVALIALLVTLVAQRRADAQAARRAVLEPHRANLANAIYSVVAFSVRFAGTASVEAAAEYKANARDAASSLDEIRRALRYPLWGLEDGFHTLCLLPRWVDHAHGQKPRLARLVQRATVLRVNLDRAVAYAVFTGNPPLRRHRWRVAYSVWRLRRFFRQSRPNPYEPHSQNRSQ